MQRITSYLLSLFLFSLCTESLHAQDKTTTPSIIHHYFGGSSKHLRQENYIPGDFNGDGIEDVAILFKPSPAMKPKAQVQLTTPWHFAGKMPKDEYHTSLAIINGHAGGFQSKNTGAFAMLDYTGVLETPSFKLILIKQDDKDYKQHQDMLPVKSSGDILVLPTEAGIDTYIYWNKDRYKLHVPEEIP